MTSGLYMRLYSVQQAHFTAHDGATQISPFSDFQGRESPRQRASWPDNSFFKQKATEETEMFSCLSQDLCDPCLLLLKPFVLLLRRLRRLAAAGIFTEGNEGNQGATGFGRFFSFVSFC
jgi:hypothetical protein